MTGWMELESIVLSEINKPVDERQILYDLTINRNLINKTNKQAKDIEMENRLTVIRGERGWDNGGKG